MTTIPISKPFIREEEKKAVLEVLDSGMLVQGERTAALEKAFSSVCGTNCAIATSSGTTALHIALLANGIGKDDEVITSPFTFIASVNSILYVGAKPVFVDIDEDTYNIDPSKIESAITKKTKAILPIHLFGHPCEMDDLLFFSRKYKLKIIEDACQAIGAGYHGKKVGGFGTGCFSLYATKNIMSGEGGMITTDDEDLAVRCRMIRNHGMQRRYYHDMLGFNFRTNDLLAAIGCVQMNRLKEFTEKRQSNAAYLSNNIHQCITPKVKPGCEHVFHQYTIRVIDGCNRDDAVKKLNDAGVGTGIFYPIPAHQQKYLAEYGYHDLHFPVAEKMSSEVISLPVHPQLSQEDLVKIAAEVNKL